MHKVSRHSSRSSKHESRDTSSPVVAAPDDVLAMTIFAHVVESQSFTAAAKKLGLSKSVVSWRISRLEERIGLRLLHRTTRKLSLTGDGLRFYEHCAGIVAAADRAARAAHGVGEVPQGTLRVNAAVSFAEVYLTDAIVEFLRLYPEVVVDLNLNDQVLDPVESGSDVAIRLGWVRDMGVVARELATARRIVCASPAYLEKHGVPRTPSDLRHHNCLRFSLWPCETEWRFSEEHPRVPLRTNFTANSALVVRKAARCGLGLVVLPTFMVVSDLKTGKLQVVLEDFAQHELELYAIYPHRQLISANVRAFVDFMATWFQKPPWETARRPLFDKPNALAQKSILPQ